MQTDDPIGVARALRLEGRPAEAELLYRKALDARPDDPDAREGLAELLLLESRAAEAAVQIRRALTVRPDSHRLHAGLGEALRMLGRLDEALESLRRATRLDPTFAPAWNSLGLLAHARGHHDYAETAFREAIRLGASFATTHLNLAYTFLACGRQREAADVLRRMLETQPNHPVAMSNLGRILGELGDPGDLGEAEALCRRALELASDRPHAMNNLAHVLRIRGRDDEARELFQEVETLVRTRSRPGQVAGDRPGSRLSPNPSPSRTAEDLHARGLMAWKLGRLDEADESFRGALCADPAAVESWLRLARIQQERGEVRASCESARSALAIRPGLAEAYRMLASALEDRLPDDDLRFMRDLLDDRQTTPEDRALLKFALGGVLDRRGCFAEAAAHFDAANALQAASKAARGLVFQPGAGAEFLRRTIAAFTPAFLEERLGWGDPDARPVFVVGLPRSGTTLVERTLASHPAVHGAGELREVSRIFQSMPSLVGRPAEHPFDALARLTPELCRQAARAYLGQLGALSAPVARRVVDKQPDNIHHLGLIALLWPGAHIIHCRRDVRDVAVSCWQSGLVATTWNNEWESMARRFKDYMKLVSFWRATRPIDWLEVDYEDVVSDLEGQARRMIDYLGLDWDPACLQFHERPGVVRTPSLLQVRRPVHSRSVGRWRNYEPFIQPMFRAFERHALSTDAEEPASGRPTGGVVGAGEDSRP